MGVCFPRAACCFVHTLCTPSPPYSFDLTICTRRQIWRELDFATTFDYLRGEKCPRRTLNVLV